LISLGLFFAEGKAPLEVIDIPGHERLRSKYFDEVKPSLRAIVYLVDSATLQKQLRDVAEYLFAALSDPAVADKALPVLVACNKQDLPLAKGSSVIRRELEKELNLLRRTQARSLDDTEHQEKSMVFLGNMDKEFSFDDLQNEVTFSETSSVSDDGLRELKEFLTAVA